MTHDPLTLMILVIVTAVIFDFVNGFHDAANSIATIVATKVLKPWQAVLWAAFFNFIALFFFSTGVAKTVGNGMIGLSSITTYVILAGLIGAILWGLLTWWLRLPTSSSHALLGGYAGAAIAHSILKSGTTAAFDSILFDGWTMILLFIIVAPAMAMVVAQIFLVITAKFHHLFKDQKGQNFFAYMQLISSALLSLMHGANDAQKTAGIIAGALVTAGFNKDFSVPNWVLALSYFTMALGTLMGGWRIVHTLGKRITRLNTEGGFCAEMAAALSIFIATMMRLPVSTTQAATGAIIGVGVASGQGHVNWGMAHKIFWAWILTIPAAGLFGAGIIYGLERLSP